MLPSIPPLFPPCAACEKQIDRIDLKKVLTSSLISCKIITIHALRAIPFSLEQQEDWKAGSVRGTTAYQLSIQQQADGRMEVDFSNLPALISELHVDIDYFRERKGTEKPTPSQKG